MQVLSVKREFVLKLGKNDEKKFPDPDPKLSIDEVADHYSLTTPEFAIAALESSEEIQKAGSNQLTMRYTFKTEFKDKG